MGSVFDSSNRANHTESLAFLDPNGGVTLQRYDTMKYRQFEKLTEKQLSFFWLPHEVDILRDAKDFKDLTDHEQHIFTSNLKRQILLDSVQGRAPTLAFGPICSLPELETWINTWTFFETIHSESYTHILRAIYPDPSVVFDDLPNIKEIVDCATSITQAYDNLMNNPSKKNIYLALVAANALEAIRFYVSFAGTVNATNTTITAISDQRLKENIRDLDDGLEKVMALQPRKFDWKEGKGADIKNARGFIAQEFEAVFPDQITLHAPSAAEKEWVGDDKVKAIQQNLTPYLVKAIQELKAELDAAKAEIAALKGAA